jgi:AcrR family transcriptional regulator
LFVTACPTCGSLRAAALQLVGEHGFKRLSVAALCDACGLTPDQLADHYPTPRACLYDAYDELAQEFLHDMQDAFDRASSGADALTRARSRMLARLAERPAEARLLFIEVLRGDRELRRRREQGRQRILALMLSEHRRRGELEQRRQVQLEMLLGASFHLIATRIAEGRIDALPELDGELAELAGMFEPRHASVAGPLAAAV